MTCLLAFTEPGVGYPGFVSINRQLNGDVTVTVRAEPKIREGVHVCAFAHQAGPGRCTPGGPTCNNYCNMAPSKGPMQDSPLPCTHIDEGVQASFTMPAEAWARLEP